MFKNLNATISKPKEMLDSMTKWVFSGLFSVFSFQLFVIYRQMKN
jgi:hypothetical protein